MPIDILLEGLLFYKSAPQKKQAIMKLYGISAEDLSSAVAILSLRLVNGATRVLETDTELQLVTTPEMAPIIEAMRKTELKADIGKAGAETLAIILYQEPITRSAIDRIRGVNSSFILRNLQIRGLVERTSSKQGSGYEYIISPSLLSHLGTSRKHELPDFARITDAIEKFSITNEPETVV